MMTYDKLAGIKAVVLDIDGVLTDNQILVTDHGEFLRLFNVRDGYAIKRALSAGIQIGVISGGRSVGTRKRLEILGVEEIHLGIEEKLPVLKHIIVGWNLQPTDIAYMGDDVPDVACMQYAGLSCCPSDSVQEILEIATFISPLAGGQGCVRDLLEKILRAQSKW